MLTYFIERDNGYFFYPEKQNSTDEQGIDWDVFSRFVTAVNEYAASNYKTVEFAIYELYQHAFPKIVHSETVGNVVKSTHERGMKTIVVMATVTAAYTRAHREFVRYIEHGDGYGHKDFNVSMRKMRQLISAINGLALTAAERIYLLASYENMLATY